MGREGGRTQHPCEVTRGARGKTVTMNYSGTGSAVQPEGIMGNHLYSNRASILLPYIPSEPCTAHYLPPTTDGRQQCVCVEA